MAAYIKEDGRRKLIFACVPSLLLASSYTLLLQHSFAEIGINFFRLPKSQPGTAETSSLANVDYQILDVSTVRQPWLDYLDHTMGANQIDFLLVAHPTWPENRKRRPETDTGMRKAPRKAGCDGDSMSLCAKAALPRSPKN